MEVSRGNAFAGVVMVLVAVVDWFALPTVAAQPSASTTKPYRSAPNIVLILLDDVGFGASSTFGGPIQTPELDKLAAQGLRYNRFHVTALCAPTRAALLSGRNDHQVGYGSLAELPVAQRTSGYSEIWPKDAASVADILRRHGYSTAAFGKWHNTPYSEISPVGPFDRWPTGLGFEYFYGFMRGLDDQFEPTALYRNTTPVEPSKTPAQGYHLTADLVEEAIKWIQTHQSLAPEKPYFVYFAPGATHMPFEVAQSWTERYRGHFDGGWDELRKETFARQTKLGVIPASAELTLRPTEIPAWNSLSPDKKKLSAREMEVYAAFLAQTDHEVGRLLEAVRSGAAGDNTIVLYIVGDNGAEGMEGVESDWSESWVQGQLKYVTEIGSVRYPGFYTAGWAWAMDTPFQWMKHIASHLGGTRDPLIVSWPRRIKDLGGLRSQHAHVVDIAPTLYEIAGIEHPLEGEGVQQQPLSGVSLAYTFAHPEAPSRHHVQIFEQEGNRSIYQDGWLAAARHSVPWNHQRSKDFSHDRWELYHIEEDYSELHDVAAQYLAKLKELQRLFEQEAAKNNIYPLQNPIFGNPANAANNKRQFVFYPGLPRIPATTAPNFEASSYVISADLAIPRGGAEGTILSFGGLRGGFALYAIRDRLVYEATDGEKHTVVTADVTFPTGKTTVTCEFTRGRTYRRDGRWWASGVVGSVRLAVDGRVVGEAPSVRVSYDTYSGTFGIGQSFGSPVSEAFIPPFIFTGTLQQVKVDLK